MQTDNFRVTVVEECDVVEICGALKVGSESGLPKGVTLRSHDTRPSTDLVDFCAGRSRNALWVRPFCRLHGLREKFLSFQLFGCLADAFIQSDLISTFVIGSVTIHRYR